jgi:hypothetical protein
MLHTCHHPSCEVAVPRHVFACPRHWFGLPPAVRRAIKVAYQPGQELGRVPVSREYVDAAGQARTFWSEAA